MGVRTGNQGVSPARAPRTSSGVLRGRLVLAALLVLVLASGFNMLLHLASLEKMWVETLSDGARLVGGDVKGNIERSVRYGKRLDKFVGMGDLLGEAVDRLVTQNPMRRANGVEFVSIDSGWRVDIADAKRRVLYSTDESRLGERISAAGLGAGPKPYERNGRRVVPLSLRDANGKVVGVVLTSFRKEAVSGALASMARDESIVGGLVFLGAAVLFWLSLFLILPHERARIAAWLRIKAIDPSGSRSGFPRKALIRTMLVAVILCQAIYSYYAAEQYKDNLHRIVRGKVVAVSSILRDDIEYVVAKGVHLGRLPGVEKAMGDMLRAVPEANAMVMADDGGRVLHLVGEDAGGEDGSIPVRVPINGPDGTVVGSIAAYISADIFSAQLRDVVLDSVTILVIAVLFAIELAILVMDFFQRSSIDRERTLAEANAYSAVRPAGFLLLFGVDSSLSFIPLHMKGLAGSFLGLPQEMLIALPISVEMFAAGLMIAVSGAWVDRKGWRQPLLAGLALCVFGFVASWEASGALLFLVARGLVGMGYGLALMSMQGFVVQHTDERTRGRGFSQFWAGVYAGSVCGVAAGALVAQQVGYAPVFLFGAAVLVLALGYCAAALVGTGGGLDGGVGEHDGEEEEGCRFLGYSRFLSSRNVLFTVLLANIPAALAIIGLLNYFTPVYLDAAGISQGDIGRIFMLNSLAIIVTSQLSGGRIDRTSDKRGWIVLAGVLGATAFFFFSLVEGVVVVLGAVVLLGVSSSIVLTAVGAFVLGLDESARLGAGRATAMVASTYRVGQVLGPVVFGWLAAFDAGIVMPLFGSVYLLLSLAYPVLVRKGVT